MTARITYNSINCDFKVRFDTLDFHFTQERSQNRAGSGKIETVNLHGIIEVSFAAIMSATEYYNMVGFFSWARQGKTFSFTPYSSLVANATLNGAATSDLIPITTNTGLSTGDYCLIRAADDDEFEIVRITGLTATSASVSSAMVFDYAVGDTLRHLYYIPSAILLNTDFNPMELQGSSYYEFQFNIIEAL